MRANHNPEIIVDQVMTAAEIPAGIVRPDPYPAAGGFVVYFANGGGSETRVTDNHMIELEGWGQGPIAAAEQLDAAVYALHQATGQHGIRHVREAGRPVRLPTGEEGWDRYTMAVEITTRRPQTGA